MGIQYKHRSLIGANFLGNRLFEGTDLSYSLNGGTITKEDDGILFTSTGNASWFLFIQPVGTLDKFKKFKDLENHRLTVEADLEWINTSNENAKLIISVGFYTSPDPSYGHRLKYRDILSDNTNSFETHIFDSFISNYSSYPGGGSTSGLDNYYFTYRVFLNAPAGGLCKLKKLNIYDLGE